MKCPINQQECVLQECQVWNIEYNDCGLKTKQLNYIIDLLKHEHNHHLHPLQHDCSVVPDKNGQSNKTGAAISSILLNEFMDNTDLDDNGYIYGIDFKIKNSSQKPVILTQLELSPGWQLKTNELNKDLIEVDWIKFRDWMDYPIKSNNPFIE